MPTFDIQVNGRSTAVEAVPSMPLLWVLRDRLGLTGTKYGCGAGLCGACTVLVDGEAAPSCLLPIERVGTSAITTIEGLSEAGDHPVQRAWKEGSVPQCGYCQAGQILRAAALIDRTPDPDERQIREGMNANLCRCGTYVRIAAAVRRASALARGE
jgi:aerobic-type carbon monoxide dehydrogenase small subunit (CoxS/CutS family)